MNFVYKTVTYTVNPFSEKKYIMGNPNADTGSIETAAEHVIDTTNLEVLGVEQSAIQSINLKAPGTIHVGDDNYFGILCLGINEYCILRAKQDTMTDSKTLTVIKSQLLEPNEALKFWCGIYGDFVKIASDATAFPDITFTSTTV